MPERALCCPRFLSLSIKAALLLISVASGVTPLHAQLPTRFEVFEVTVDSLRLRTEPSTDSDVIRLLESGETVLIVKREGEWARVYARGDPSFGWVFGAYLKGPDD